MSILLIFPKQESTVGNFGNYAATHPPLSICCLSAFLKQQHFETYCLDLNHAPEDRVLQMIREHAIKIVGFSITTFTFGPCYRMARRIRKAHPDVKIVFGGMAAEFFTSYLTSKTIDIMVLGEGEEPFAEVIGCYLEGRKELHEIGNIAFYKGGKIVKTSRSAPHLPLDALPFPDRDCLSLPQYFGSMNIQCYIATSRFCPYNCIFCLSGTCGHIFRTRSVENVVREIKHIKKTYPFYKKYHFVDETLNTSAARFESLCRAIGKEDIYWSCNLRVSSSMTEEMVQLMKDTGNVAFEIGIESGSQKVLDKINKGIDLKHVERVLSAATRLGIPVIGTFMAPHYCDTPETLRESWETVVHMAEEYSLLPLLSWTVVHPRSRLAQLKETYGIKTDAMHQIVQTRTLSSREIKSAIDRYLPLYVESVRKHSWLIMSGYRVNLDHLDPSVISGLLRDQAEKVITGPLEVITENKPSTARGKIGRNAMCPCGSGKKYKKCCIGN